MRISTVERIAKKIASGALDIEAARTAAVDLRDRIEKAFLRSKALAGFTATDRSGEVSLEYGVSPFVFLQYWNVMSADYATSLTLVLQDAKLKCLVRTLNLKDGQGANSQNIQVAGTHSNRLEADVSYFNVEGLAKLAVHRGLEQRVSMLNALGFTVTKPTMKKLLKTVTMPAALAF